MVPIAALWIPILLSAVIVFVASSIIHMLLPYHRSDHATLPDESKVMNELRKHSLPPGDYLMPRAGSMKEMGSSEFIEKMKKGPVVFMTVTKSGPPSMAGNLVKWFVYSVVVGISRHTSRAVLSVRELTTWRYSDLPDAPPSSATAWHSGRIRSGTSAPGRQLSSRLSTDSSTGSLPEGRSAGCGLCSRQL